VMDIKHPNTLSRRVNKSETLMRRYVEKPDKKASTKLTPKITRTDLIKIKKVTTKPLANIKAIDEMAKKIPKSHLITKFQDKVNIEPIITSKPVRKGIEISKTMKPIIDEKITNPTKKLIEKSINYADSQEMPLLPKENKSLRWLIISFVLALTLFILIQVIDFLYPKIQISLANHTAGFSATIPETTPAGYSLGDINAKSAQIVINYNSNSSKATLSITEKPSKWDNQTLIQSFLVPNGYVSSTNWTYKGITIYSFGTANNPGFTWVNGGIWYVVRGNSIISNNQLENIVSTM